MPLHHRSRFAALAFGAGLALLLPSTAHASTPVITDPAGDAGVTAYPCQPNLGIAVDPCLTTVPALSEPGIDIVEADVVLDGTDLLFSIKVVDIDAAPLQTSGRTFSFGTTYAGLSVHVRVSHVGQFDTTATGSFDVVNLASTGSGTAVDATLDPTTNVLQWTVPLTDANAALADVCASCTPIGAGSTLQDFSARAGYELDPTGSIGVPCVGRCDGAETRGTSTL
ncbi:MAG TPA: hypothetical protein VM938_02600 [Acidimicrobiales bacterium]|nr:hypothetical protein [Acidimicrobiales bacterium]